MWTSCSSYISKWCIIKSWQNECCSCQHRFCYSCFHLLELIKNTKMPLPIWSARIYFHGYCILFTFWIGLRIGLELFHKVSFLSVKCFWLEKVNLFLQGVENCKQFKLFLFKWMHLNIYLINFLLNTCWNE